jgi:hypothetical protein
MLIGVFGTVDYPKLQQVRILIGFDPDERVSKRLPHYLIAAYKLSQARRSKLSHLEVI